MIALASKVLPKLRNLLSRAMLFGYNLVFTIFMKWWYRTKYGIKRKKWGLVVFNVLFPVVVITGSWLTGFLDYIINFSLSFVFFFFNLAYFIVHTTAYLIMYIPAAILDYGLKFFAGIWDNGIIAKIPGVSDYAPKAMDYVIGLNIIGHLNAFFYGSAAANAAATADSPIGAFGLVHDPPKVGDFLWRPVTVDLNNPNGDYINPDPRTVENPPKPDEVWYTPIVDSGGGDSGGSSWDSIDWSDPSGWDCSGSSCTWVGDTDGGTDLSAVHDYIDEATGGSAENYDPISDGGTSAGTHLGSIIDDISDGSWFGGF